MADDLLHTQCSHADARVIDSRAVPDNHLHTKRRYRCLLCGHKWNTLEMPVEEIEENRGTREKSVVTELMDTLGRYGFVLRD